MTNEELRFTVDIDKPNAVLTFTDTSAYLLTTYVGLIKVVSPTGTTVYKNSGYDFRGLYVGGGTPTIMMDELTETISLIKDCFHIQEISVETNPNHLTEVNIEGLKKSGVNRLSVGVQSFDDDLLKAMDRYEKYGSGETIITRLKVVLGRFDTLNADMIFNFSSQTSESLGRDLDILHEIGIDQVTYYPLMVSDLTRRAVEKTLGRVDYRREKKFYRQIVERLTPSYRFSSAWCFSRKESMIDEYIVGYNEYAGELIDKYFEYFSIMSTEWKYLLPELAKSAYKIGRIDTGDDINAELIKYVQDSLDDPGLDEKDKRTLQFICFKIQQSLEITDNPELEQETQELMTMLN